MDVPIQDVQVPTQVTSSAKPHSNGSAAAVGQHDYPREEGKQQDGLQKWQREEDDFNAQLKQHKELKQALVDK